MLSAAPDWAEFTIVVRQALAGQACFLHSLRGNHESELI
jgi:hypothetical protein